MNENNRFAENRLNREELFGSATVYENYPLAQCSTFRIGGNADYAAFPESAEELIKICAGARRLGIPVYVAGNASNTLFDDAGYRGVVIVTSGMRRGYVSGCEICVDCGLTLSGLAVLAQKNSVAGFEFFYGIPGTVGGAVYMNSGAFGGEAADLLTESTYYDMDTGETITIRSEEHGFSYRKSCYVGTNRVILSAKFLGNPGNAGEIKALMDEHILKRTESQPLEYPSAGSVFKRCTGHYTSKLIEEAGLKGRTVGRAQVSLKHAGFIVNLGGATANDVKTLIGIIKNEIYEKYGIAIETEVIIAPTM